MTGSERFVNWFRNAGCGALGPWGEKFWSSVFHDAGLGYIKLCDIASGGAPMLQGNGKVILPDFQVHGGMRYQIYADSKCKSGPVFFRLGREWRQGIDRRNWEHYLDIAALHGKHCALAIFEGFNDEKTKAAWSGAMLLQTLHRLGPPCQGFSSMQHMVLWPRDRFKVIGTVSPEEAQRITYAAGAAVRFRDDVRAVFEIGSQDDVQGRLF